MPPTVSNPRDLFLLELADILFVERLLAFQVLPDMLGKVRSAELAGALAGHLEQTKRHVTNVEEAFAAMGAEASSAHSPPFVGLVDQHGQLAGNMVSPLLADLFHAYAAIHAEHYEIATYRHLRMLAGALGAQDADRALEANLGDEEQALGALEAAAGELAAGLQ